MVKAVVDLPGGIQLSIENYNSIIELSEEGLVPFPATLQGPFDFIIFYTTRFPGYWKKLKFPSKNIARNKFLNFCDGLKKDLDGGNFDEGLGTGGDLKKRRFEINQGKSNGARVIYNFYGDIRAVCLLIVYTHEIQDNISENECNWLKKVSERAKKQIIKFIENAKKNNEKINTHDWHEIEVDYSYDLGK
jgi:hypothetical protein